MLVTMLINMSLSKKKSRSITVDETEYRFQISTTWNPKDDSHLLNITVQIASGHGNVLQAKGLITRDVWTDCAAGKKVEPEEWAKTYLIVRPPHIARLIRRGITEGWNPETLGPPFITNVTYNEVFK